MQNFLRAAAFVSLLLPGIGHAQLATLTIHIQGLEPTTGSVEVSLFNSADTFMKEVLVQQTKPVDGNTELVFEFSGLLEGKYAAVAVHEENGDGVFDNGFLGIGGESYGYSNDAGPWLGRPSFEAAAFMVGTEDLEITFQVD